MTITYRQATIEDASTLLPVLRESDRKEITLSGGPDVLATIQTAINISDVHLAAEDENGLLCVFGIARLPDNNSIGVIWLLGTERVTEYPHELHVTAKRWIKEMLSNYSRLVTCVHAENVTSIGWLKGLGFSMGPLIEEYGHGKAPFYLFALEGNDNV